MPAMSLEELLRSSLEGVNHDFLEADKALHAEVAAASDALSKISGGALKLRLDRFTETESGVVYRFFLESNQAGGAQLGGFQVSIKGFPIWFGLDDPSRTSGKFSHEIQDPSQLTAFFHDMASNQDSPLVQKAAFLMRKKGPA